MKFVTAHGLIKKATDKIERAKWWDIWLINFSKMTKETYESFDLFYERMITPICMKPSCDIIDEVEKIRKKVKERDGNI